MKKLTVALLIGTMLLWAAGCAGNGKNGTAASSSAGSAAADSQTEEDREVIIGGWSTNQSDDLPQDAADALYKAVEELDGAAYEPVRLLASQVVAGTNYAVLCRITPVVPDPVGSYALVTVYADLENHAEITSVRDFIDEAGEQTDGDWTPVNDEQTVHAADDALKRAAADLDGAAYETTAVIASKMTGGTNYMILSRVTPVTPEAEAVYCLVTVSADAEGRAELQSVSELEY